MHEWALAESILTAAVEEAEKQKLKRITEIKIALGELQQIEQDIFEFALNEIMYNDFYSNEVYIENDYLFIPIPVMSYEGFISYFYAIYLIITGPRLYKCKIRHNYWNEPRILPKFFHKFETGGYYYIVVDALYVSWDPTPAREPNCDF